ncbi:hypothetical protein NB311A_12549 [Nitrobacter sp. Nb-311A]|uniref:DUF2793 domain-containing protein n=1 Tax=unclassified Nitrobacter TaxID=2620411 RepID=UPI0000684C78|nr:hypothetical protein NB311A_12549 [Nitrobacter sp. Nb-311A]
MTDTPNLGLPYIDGSQAQKHVTHNEALRILDAAVQIGVLDLTLTAPPSSPADGERYVVASGATGDWAGKDDAIATWQDGAWAFLTPKAGWCIWSAADESLFVFDGSAWQGAGGTASLDNVAHLGVNTAASSPQPPQRQIQRRAVRRHRRRRRRHRRHATSGLEGGFGQHGVSIFLERLFGAG